MTYLDYLEQKVLLERLVIGLEEPVLIKGLGELSAKIDSGNGGYNVIHGTDFHQQGDELMFTTHDSFGHEKKMQATVIDTIEVNMGGGNIESRPVIELDIKFAGEDYKKIPFSVSDRSSNTNPILISKGFVENELEALIDVGAMNISHEGIDVVYGEGVGDFLKTGASKVGSSIGNAVKNSDKPIGKHSWGLTKGAGGKLGKGLWNLTKGAFNTVSNTIKNSADIMAGKQGSLKGTIDGVKQAAGGALGATVGYVGLRLGAIGLGVAGVVKLAKAVANLTTVIKEDSSKVRKAAAGTILADKILKNKNVTTQNTIWENFKSTDFGSIPIVPVVTYKCRTGENGHVIKGLEELVKLWKSEIAQAKKAVKTAKGNKEAQATEESEEELILSESLLLLQDDTTGVPSTTGDAVKQGADAAEGAQGTPTEEKPADTPTETTEEPQEQKKWQIKDEELQKTAAKFENLNNFILYYIPSGLKEGKINKVSVEAINQVLQSEKLDSILSKFFYIGKVDGSSSSVVVKLLAKNLRNGVTKAFGRGMPYQGFFALATGQGGARKIHIYENVDEVVYRPIDQEVKSVDETSPKELEAFSKTLSQKLPDIFTIIGSNAKIITYIRNNPQTVQKLDTSSQRIINNAMQAAASQGNNGTTLNYKDFYEEIKPVLEKGSLQNIILQELLPQSELGKKISQFIPEDQEITSWDDFVKFCYENSDIQKIISQPDSEQEEEWISNKLQLLKNKGLI